MRRHHFQRNIRKYNIDESTESSGIYIAHALIGVLREESPGRSYILTSKKTGENQ